MIGSVSFTCFSLVVDLIDKRVLLGVHSVKDMESNQRHHVLRGAITFHQSPPCCPGGFVFPAHSSPNLERHQGVVGTVKDFTGCGASVKMVWISNERQQRLELLSLLVGDHWGSWHRLVPLQKLD